MKVKKLNHEGISFYCREGTSDEKTFDEVIVGETYKRRDFKIESGEKWVDLGGNVGAFTIWACSKGAKVDVYEPDPFNCKMIEKNLKANDFNANIHQKAVVCSDAKKMFLYIGNNNQTWRNSLYKNWGNQKIAVDCIHFSEVIKSETNLKMDIEGAEMEILEAMKAFPRKMVFEWSFDIDPSLTRYREIVKVVKSKYENVRANNYNDDFDTWQASWFPPCTNVFVYK